MSTYPGEDPRPSEGSEPSATQRQPDHEPGYWERQATAGQPSPDQPPYAQPTYGQPDYAQPTYGQPDYAQPTYGQPDYAQPTYGPPYGQAGPPPGYGAPQGYPPYGVFDPVPPTLGRATTAMVLGIVGLASIVLLCGIGLVVSPFAWGLGHSALKEIRASGGRLGGESQAKAGMVMGIIGTVLLVLAVIALVLLIGLGVASSSSDSGTAPATSTASAPARVSG